ncbi:MAG: hypothetical protein KatS3mg111_4091 [Pirellulaceae bacterium]|nr:MAG: hypothetical protein KatS3mg111_4091 [Pirellulaceae bacterium]
MVTHMSTSTQQSPAPHRAASDSMVDRSPVEPVRIDPPHGTANADAHATNQPASGDGPQTSVLLTVLMPCLNESRTLDVCIAEAHQACRAAGLRDVLAANARELGADAKKGSEHDAEPRSADVDLPSELPAYEILIADNGSTDDSVAVAEAAGARVVHVKEKGYGAALRGGIAAARGKYVVMADSDCSYNFGDIPRFLAKLQEGFDLVVGNRFAGGIEPGAMPWHHRWIGNPVLSGLGRLLYRTPIRDWHCGLRAFDRQKVLGLGLESSGMEFASEMILRASQARLAMAELPTTLRPDGRDRRPHLRSIRDGLRHAAALFSARLRFRGSGNASLFLPGEPMFRTILSQNSLYLVLCGMILIALGFGMHLAHKVGERQLVGSDLRNRAEPLSSRAVTPTQSHDFGVVHSQALLTHTFEVLNNSDIAWTVKRVQTTCNCTVGNISRTVIPPGETAQFDVQYRAPTRDGNDTRRVRLTFAESRAPTLVFEIKASVRLSMDPQPRSIQANAVPATESVTRRVLVLNFGPDDWHDIGIRESPSWLSIQPVKLSRRPSHENCRQTWAVDFHIDGAALQEAPRTNPTGIQSHTCELVAYDAEGKALDECVVGVTASPYLLVRVVPRTARLLPRGDGTYATRLSVRFPGDYQLPTGQTPVLEHSLDDGLNVEWYRIAGYHWDLHLTCSKEPGFTKSVVRVGPDENTLVEIPIEVVRPE